MGGGLKWQHWLSFFFIIIIKDQCILKTKAKDQLLMKLENLHFGLDCLSTLAALLSYKNHQY